MSPDFKSSSLQSDTSFTTRCERFSEYFEAYLSDLLKNLDSEVRDFAAQVCLAGGKRIRPLLIYNFASSPAGGNSANFEALMKASAVLEMVHVATLVHDDILDDASTRRGSSTLHQTIGTHKAVLLGDALFSYALELASEFPTSQICRIVARATKQTCSGEIRQTFSRGSYDVSMDQYIEFINDKTGELFSASCEVGSLLGGEDEEACKISAEFGLSLGVNYQVYDDLIDAFGEPKKSGKTLRSDWNSGKITLPLILLLRAASTEDHKRVTSLLSTMDTEGNNSGLRNMEIFEFFEKYQILSECTSFLLGRYEHTLSLVNRLSNPSVQQNLGEFLASFSGKFASVHSLKTSNFLAC